MESLGDPGERTALLHRGREISYRALASEVERVASGLAAEVGAGERLLCWLPNGPELVCLLLACLRSGVVPVPLHAGITSAELPPLAVPLRARGLVAAPELLSRHADAVAGIDVGRVYPVPSDGDAEGAPRYGGLLRDPGSGVALAQRRDPCLVLHTSGSKGRPKGVVLSRDNLDSVLAYRLGHTQLSAGSLSIMASCLTQSVGLYQSLAMLAAGGTLVLLEGYDVDAMAELVDRHRPTHLIMVVEAFDRLLHHPKTTPEGLSRLHFGAVGADRVTRRVQQRAIALTGRPLRASYGLTESSWALLNPADRPGKCLALGRPTPGVEISLRDAAQNEVATGEVGEIWIRSPRNMWGYWGAGTGSGTGLEGDWLASGDLARRDADGDYWFAGRKKNLIVLPSGDNVSPQEVEDVLHAHPAVANAIVVGVESGDGGERPWAFVVPEGRAGDARDSRTRLEPAELEAYLRERLSRSKLPQRIVLLDELPTGRSGKVHRDAIVARFAAERA